MPFVDMVFQITLVESERGWGQKSWHQYYDTEAEAHAAIKRENAHNTAPTAPDWYIRAELDVKMVPRAESEKDKYRG